MKKKSNIMLQLSSLIRFKVFYWFFYPQKYFSTGNSYLLQLILIRIFEINIPYVLQFINCLPTSKQSTLHIFKCSSDFDGTHNAHCS